MNINDIIYFSPMYKMKDLKFDDKDIIINAFADRIESYYFVPIRLLNDYRYAYGAGVLLVSLVDAFARYSTSENSVGARIEKWIIDNINLNPYTTSSKKAIEEKETIAKIFYEDFRCGLVHESHIKNGGQFSYEIQSALQSQRGFIIINPILLYEELEKFFINFSKELFANEALYAIFLKRIKGDFEEEAKLFEEAFKNDNYAG